MTNIGHFQVDRNSLDNFTGQFPTRLWGSPSLKCMQENYWMNTNIVSSEV